MDTKTILEAVEVIRDVKSLFVAQDPYLPVYAALGGAFVGGVASIIPTSITNWLNTRRERRATALQLYAEVKSYLEVIEHRHYIDSLSEIVDGFVANKFSSYTYQVQVNEERFFIFKNSVGRLGLLSPATQVKIVEFYQLLEAIVQDVKPGGMLNAQPVGQAAYEEVLSLTRKAKTLGLEVASIIAKEYKLK